jgi:hypothetical protein
LTTEVVLPVPTGIDVSVKDVTKTSDDRIQKTEFRNDHGELLLAPRRFV